MVFSGTYEHSIDSKNRLAIPAQIRETLERLGLGRRLYVAPGPRPRTLALWPERHFIEMAKRLPRSPIPDPDQVFYEQLFFSAAFPVEMDNQGRVLLPERSLRLAEINKQVVILGVFDHLEVWNKDDFEAVMQDFWEQYPKVQQKAREVILRGIGLHRPEPQSSEWET